MSLFKSLFSQISFLIMESTHLPKEMNMKLTPPKQTTFTLAVIIGILGILAELVPIAVLSPYAFWLVVVAFVLLVLAVINRGL